jgi:TusA-related sulfurtransferase
VGDAAAARELDLRGTPCPLNYIRTKLALEALTPGQMLTVSLDRGEPEQMVQQGIAADGHQVACQPHPHDAGAIQLQIRRHGS